MRIENPTLAHFRHFSSLFTLSPLYICRDASTNHLFLCKTNPILSAVGGLQMNVNLYNTTDYENKWQRRVRKNKPKTNPNKPNLRKAKMNINSIITKDYRKKDDFAVRINKANFRKAKKWTQTLSYKRIMKMKPPSGPKKTNPIQTQFPQRQNYRKFQ